MLDLKTPKQNEIYGEINRRSHRIKYMEIFRMKSKIIDDAIDQDISWIERVCESDGYDPVEFLVYYRNLV